MEYRLFGRTGVKVSALALGCMNFGGRLDEAASIEIIDRALDAGINFVDTANVYGHDPADFTVGRGRSEEIVGRALRRSSRRDKVFLATKVHYPMGEGPNDRGNGRQHIISQCEASLRRLDTDHIDLYILHAFDRTVALDETLSALDNLIQRGLIRHVGASGFPAWRHVQARAISNHLGLSPIVSEQPPYNLLDRSLERELLPMAQTYGLAVTPWAPLAGGFLSGSYRRNSQVPTDSRYDVFWGGARAAHTKPHVYDVVEGLAALAQGKGCSPAQLALGWLMERPGTTSPIIGPRTVEHLESALGALEIELTDEDRLEIDRIAPPGRMTVPYYGGFEYDGEVEQWEGWKPDLLPGSAHPSPA